LEDVLEAEVDPTGRLNSRRGHQEKVGMAWSRIPDEERFVRALLRQDGLAGADHAERRRFDALRLQVPLAEHRRRRGQTLARRRGGEPAMIPAAKQAAVRSEEHTSELQSR